MMHHEPGWATCFPELAAAGALSIQEGWDSEVFEVADQIVRVPRRREVAVLARAEARMLPILAGSLPVEVPTPLETCDEHASIRYRRIAGESATFDRLARFPRDVVGDQVAAFLSAMRAIPIETAREAGVPDRSGSAWREHYRDLADRFAQLVVPRLQREYRAPALSLLAAFRAMPSGGTTCVVHSDLGSNHLLCDDRGLRGVIDWGDVQIGDPAIDLVWALHVAPSPIGSIVRERLAVGDAEMERARLYHQLGPWYEVEHGLRTGDEAFVASGIRGAVHRLAV